MTKFIKFAGRIVNTDTIESIFTLYRNKEEHKEPYLICIGSIDRIAPILKESYISKELQEYRFIELQKSLIIENYTGQGGC